MADIPEEAVEQEPPTCGHRWYWRRKRNATRGYWECPSCGTTSEWVGLDSSGHALHGPPAALLLSPDEREAMRMALMQMEADWPKALPDATRSARQKLEESLK